MPSASPTTASPRLASAARLLDDGPRPVACELVGVTGLVDLEVRDEELGVLGKIADAFEEPAAEAQGGLD